MIDDDRTIGAFRRIYPTLPPARRREHQAVQAAAMFLPDDTPFASVEDFDAIKAGRYGGTKAERDALERALIESLLGDIFVERVKHYGGTVDPETGIADIPPEGMARLRADVAARERK